MDYLRMTLAQTVGTTPREKWILAWLLAAAEAVKAPFTGGLFGLVLLLWTMDGILGIVWAARNHCFDIGRLSKSLIKLTAYVVLMVVASVIKTTEALIVGPAGDVPAFVGLLFESYVAAFVIWTESASVVRNMSKTMESFGVPMAGLQKMARWLDAQARARLKGMEEPEPDSISVLLVEDDEDAEYAIRQHLQGGETKIMTRTARTLRQALKEIGFDPTIDLVILDLNLPDSKGMDTLQRVMESLTTAPAVVVYSALDDTATAGEALRAGATDYLVKGADTSEALRLRLWTAVQREREYHRRLDLLTGREDHQAKRETAGAR